MKLSVVLTYRTYILGAVVYAQIQFPVQKRYFSPFRKTHSKRVENTHKFTLETSGEHANIER